MPNRYQKTAEQWVELIANNELPVITSTAKMLDEFANDDVSSLTKLSEAILPDQALSSCLLKVANSIPHFGIAKVTTVSRAAVMLGIHTVKNICLTSKLIDGLLKSKSLSPEIYRHLTRLMANSFYAGVLAKMMVPHYSDDTQEEVYLAAMLYRIGETAFWTTGGELTNILFTQQYRTADEFYQRCHELMGAEFFELSKGLAQTWNLGDLLVKALDEPESRTVEIQTIFYADQLTQVIQSPPRAIEDFYLLLEKISVIMKIDDKQLRAKIEQFRQQAINLLRSYGAPKLCKYIKPLPTERDFSDQSEDEPFSLSEEMSREKRQLMAITQLTKLTKTSKDFNEFLQLTLQAISKTIRFERCTFLMLTSNKQQVKVRFSYNKMSEEENLKRAFNIKNSSNLLSYVIKENQAILVNDHKSRQWRDYITEDIADFIEQGAVCLAPVNINDNCIGIISAQVFNRGNEINNEDFEQFGFLVEHLTMCLSKIARH
ncbi:MAG: HDOD domain-containing protein [Gammaproteobacteria bacterium]|nr:MAG: HDOD domain-containing protein [Gammaproteobacteria bacterium]